MPEITSTRLIVGMEIHVELSTRSKMFTRAANPAHPDFQDAAPNTLVDPVVAALPGVLPVMNRRAVEYSMMVGLALHCRIAEFSKWDRKNYYYPDLPKGYQISQYDLPLCVDGYLDLPDEGEGSRRIGIIRAHLEEDTGKLGHELPGGRDYAGSLVDLNRAGTPLLEIVTQPDLASADEAVTFGQELRSICRFLGVTEGVMQRGHMRFEPNINVVITTSDGHEYATPIVEIKNLNSFKAVRGAIEHEFVRQVEQWKIDGIVQGPGAKSTRGWDDLAGRTVLQREKEDAHDYRYFPDPDLPPVVVDDAWRERVAAEVPELPLERRARYVEDYSLPMKDARALVDDRDVCFFYEACIEATIAGMGAAPEPRHAGREAAKILLNAGAKRANELGIGIHELGITPDQVAQLIGLRDADRIGSSAADVLFGHLCESDADALAIAEREGLLQVRDEGQLETWVRAAIDAQPDAARDFAGGKDSAVGRLVGAVMKASGGQADAKAVRAMLTKTLRG
ncbi:MAG: Asp-tRNA(Asn)/Glu-tRNA(Gln) amidotransferase subunit GatB [Phycisphaerales bacterium]|nr:Asp-tRNA(Asn)/Glu-tRNA(Gln) amidotransferase subunit GatB [Phycisphaerales bacterium]